MRRSLGGNGADGLSIKLSDWVAKSERIRNKLWMSVTGQASWSRQAFLYDDMMKGYPGYKENPNIDGS
jgi:hypothetical protein